MLDVKIVGGKIVDGSGGEEFIAVLPRTSLAEAREVAERIRQADRVTGAAPSAPKTSGLGADGALFQVLIRLPADR